MLKSKREFTRFDLPLIVKFRPSDGTARYSLGLSKNFSFNGLGLEARDFNFIKNENLEMEVKLRSPLSHRISILHHLILDISIFLFTIVIPMRMEIMMKGMKPRSVLVCKIRSFQVWIL